MSVISTLITAAGTVHATDSLITRAHADGRREVVSWKQTKIVRVEHWRGAMSYYGLAALEDNHGRVTWSLLDWLRQQAVRAGDHGSAQGFAEHLSSQLNHTLAPISALFGPSAGIGIHFSAYERIDDRWIPELFHVTNWLSPTYTDLRTTGIGPSRETLGTLTGTGPRPEDGSKESRLEVAEALQRGTLFRYNNGDPELYNSAANALQSMFFAMGRRGMLDDKAGLETLRRIAQNTVQVVCSIQKDFCAPGKQFVGGRVHDLIITPNGEYSSRSGD